MPTNYKRLTLNEGFKKKDANTIEFEITLPPRTDTGPAEKTLRMVFHRRHVRERGTPQPDLRSIRGR